MNTDEHGCEGSRVCGVGGGCGGLRFREVGGAGVKAEQEVVRIARAFREAREGALGFLLALHDEEEDRGYLCHEVLAKQRVWVAEREGTCVGFVAAWEGWIHHLYVVPAAQGRGVGKRLLELARQGSDRLQLWAFVENPGAIRFYEREGFRVVERTDGAGNEARRPDVRMEWVRGGI